MTKIQDVALALIKADGAEDQNMPYAVYDAYLLRARYAVEAMLDATPEMIRALKPGMDYEEVYTTMIRAALEEKP